VHILSMTKNHNICFQFLFYSEQISRSLAITGTNVIFP